MTQEAQCWKAEADTLRRIVLDALAFLERGSPESEREAIMAKMREGLDIDGDPWASDLNLSNRE